MSADPRPAAPAKALAPRHSVGRATDAFTMPFHGALLSFRAGQRMLAHPELRRALEQHQMPVRFEDD